MPFNFQGGVDRVRKLFSGGEQAHDLPLISLEEYRTKYAEYFSPGKCWMSRDNKVRIETSVPWMINHTRLDEEDEKGEPNLAKRELFASEDELWALLYDGGYEPIGISIAKNPEKASESDKGADGEATTPESGTETPAANVDSVTVEGHPDSGEDAMHIIVEAAKIRAEIETLLSQARELVVADEPNPLQELLVQIDSETTEASKEIDRLFTTPAPDNVEKLTALLEELRRRRDGAERALHALQTLSSDSGAVVASEKTPAESGGGDFGESRGSEKKTSKRKKGKGSGPDDGGEVPLVVGSSLNDASLRVLSSLKRMTSPAPIEQTLLPVESIADEGVKKATEQIFSEALASDRATVSTIIEAITTPEEYAEFLRTLEKTHSKDGDRDIYHILNFDNYEVAFRRSLAQEERSAVMALEGELKKQLYDKFEVLFASFRQELQTYYNKEKAKIDSVVEEIALDALVSSFTDGPESLQRWKKCAPDMTAVEQSRVMEEASRLLGALNHDLEARRGDLARSKEWDAFLALPKGEQMINLYKQTVKRVWQSFFDGLKDEGLIDVMTWSEKIKEWETHYLPMVRKQIVGSILGQSEVTREQGEIIFEELLRVLDREREEKRARRERPV